MSKDSDVNATRHNDVPTDDSRPVDRTAPPTRAIVLAAGRGRRLRPFTDHTPKPLLRVDGRPTLDYVLTSLAWAGVKEVCLVTRHLAHKIESYVGEGDQWGLAVTFRRQSEMLGAAHALKAAADFITQPTFVLAADYVLPADHTWELKAAYQRAGTDIAVSLKKLSESEISSRSSVRFADDGAIAEIVEKPGPDTAPSDIGASLIFIIPEQITGYLERMELSTRGEFELQSVINKMLADGYEIAGLVQPAPVEWSPPIVKRAA